MATHGSASTSGAGGIAVWLLVFAAACRVSDATHAGDAGDGGARDAGGGAPQGRDAGAPNHDAGAGLDAGAVDGGRADAGAPSTPAVDMTDCEVPSPLPGGVRPDDPFEAYLLAMCWHRVRCRGRGVSDGSIEACLETFDFWRPEREALRRATRRGALEVEMEPTARCLDELEAGLPCRERTACWSLSPYSGIGLFRGRDPVGAPCDILTPGRALGFRVKTCVLGEGFCAASAADPCVGVCRAALPADAPCSLLDDLCAGGSVCACPDDTDCDVGRCRRFLAVGEACAPGSFLCYPNACIAGVCAPYRRDGESCETVECDVRFTCRAPDGSVCRTTCAGGRCSTDLPRVGEACASNCDCGLACAPTSEAWNAPRVCLPAERVLLHGDPCDATQPCHTGICTDGVCQPRPPAPEPMCTPDSP